jgi:hypothetical protein
MTQSIPMNIFYDLSANDNVDYDNLCAICHENLDTEQSYTLPECKHRYHTNCIVTWFRNGYQNCPHCNNNPDYSYGYLKKNSLTLKTIKNFSKRKNSPKILKTYFNKLDKLNIKYKEMKDMQKIFLKQNKNDNPSNIIKESKKISSKIRETYKKICSIEFQICSLPMKTLIIPKFKKID